MPKQWKYLLAVWIAFSALGCRFDPLVTESDYEFTGTAVFADATTATIHLSDRVEKPHPSYLGLVYKHEFEWPATAPVRLDDGASPSIFISFGEGRPPKEGKLHFTRREVPFKIVAGIHAGIPSPFLGEWLMYWSTTTDTASVLLESFGGTLFLLLRPNPNPFECPEGVICLDEPMMQYVFWGLVDESGPFYFAPQCGGSFSDSATFATGVMWGEPFTMRRLCRGLECF